MGRKIAAILLLVFALLIGVANSLDILDHIPYDRVMWHHIEYDIGAIVLATITCAVMCRELLHEAERKAAAISDERIREEAKRRSLSTDWELEVFRRGVHCGEGELMVNGDRKSWSEHLKGLK